MKRVFFTVLFTLSLCGGAWGTMYCVKPDGTCTSINKANAAVASAAACTAVSDTGGALSITTASAASFSAGDIIYLSGKNASGGADANHVGQLAPPTNGTSYIGIADNSTSTYPTIARGAANRALYLVSGRDGVTVSNLNFTGSSGSVIQALDSTNNVWTNLTATAAAAGGTSCISVYGSSVTATNVTADANSEAYAPWIVENGTGASALTCTNCIGKNSTTASGFSQTGSSTISCTGCQSYGNGLDGVSANNTGSVTWTKGISYSNGSVGRATGGDGYTSHDTSTLTVTYSIGHSNWKSCVAVTGASTGVIENNSCYNNYNDTIADDYCFWVNSSGNWTIKNNICANHSYEFMLTAWATGTLDIDYNLYYPSRGENAFSFGGGAATNYAGWKTQTAAACGGGQCDSHSPTPADPRFTNAAGGVFTLRSDSPVINKGADLCSVLTNATDYAGNPVCTGGVYVGKGSAPEIGAYEFVEEGHIMYPGIWHFRKWLWK